MTGPTSATPEAGPEAAPEASKPRRGIALDPILLAVTLLVELVNVSGVSPFSPRRMTKSRPRDLPRPLRPLKQ